MHAMIESGMHAMIERSLDSSNFTWSGVVVVRRAAWYFYQMCDGEWR
jgi:hypothetical protein